MTAIAAWGNSLAVRIPRDVLERAGLQREDVVDLIVNEAGHIEIIPVRTRHRRGIPEPGVTFESLFAGYEDEPQEIRDGEGRSLIPGLDDGLSGAEREAWSQ